MQTMYAHQGRWWLHLGNPHLFPGNGSSCQHHHSLKPTQHTHTSFLFCKANELHSQLLPFFLSFHTSAHWEPSIEASQASSIHFAAWGKRQVRTPPFHVQKPTGQAAKSYFQYWQWGSTLYSAWEQQLVSRVQIRLCGTLVLVHSPPFSICHRKRLSHNIYTPLVNTSKQFTEIIIPFHQ